MGITTAFNATPWARGILLQDPDRTTATVARARAAGCSVELGGRSPRGPWTVTLHRGARTIRVTGPALPDLLDFALERWEAGADDAGHTWVAGPSEIAHAQPKRGRAVRVACGLPRTDERFRHPERTRCSACWRALDRGAAVAA